jgi:hypothetical protein
MPRNDIHLDALLRHLGAAYYESLHGRADSADVTRALEGVEEHLKEHPLPPTPLPPTPLPPAPQAIPAQPPKAEHAEHPKGQHPEGLRPGAPKPRGSCPTRRGRTPCR